MSSPPATTPAAAVFLSYAREDSEAARRIADALRAFGVEVWFDQAELRGGDTWDGKIRKQIRECVLFLAVISAQTQGRHEGYFRREWKLAVERTHDMAAGVPFIMPVVIDATAESAAAVPDEFMRVQWTRLPGALPTPDFVAQVKHLLTAPKGPVGARPPSAAQVEMRPGTAAVPASSRSRGGSFAVAAIAVGVVLSVGAWLWLRRPAGDSPSALRPEVAAAKVTSPPAVADKSIAVLPFDNMSEDAAASAFFADGVHEDILTNLALIKDLRVVSRTSVMQYRGQKKPIREIARELGVAYILEGSVRRAGQQVRVTGQLIKAATDEHVWASKYDKDVTDVFVIQSQLAQAIASELHAALSPETQHLLTRKPTENLAAYDLFLKAREIRNRDGTSFRESLEKQESFLLSAVALDPQFAAAWGNLGWTHAAFYFWNFDRTPGRLEKAREAIGHALRLGPELPDVRLSAAWFHYFAERSYDKALGEFEQVERMMPSSAEPRFAMAAIFRRQGRWTESMDSYWTVVRKDPHWLDALASGSMVFVACRRYRDASEILTTATTHHPRDIFARGDLASVPFRANGSTGEIEKCLAGFSAAEGNTREALYYRIEWALLRGDLAEALRADAVPAGQSEFYRSLMIATALYAYGRSGEGRERATPMAEQLRGRIKLEPQNETAWSYLGSALALLGEKDEAMRSVRRAVELLPVSVDSWAGMFFRERLAFVLAWTGDKDAALQEYRYLLSVPSYSTNVHYLRRLPHYHPLRGDPRFEALLNDPQNNAPLF